MEGPPEQPNTPARTELAKNREQRWNYLGGLHAVPIRETLPNFRSENIAPQDAADGIASLGISSLRVAYFRGQGRVLASRWVTTEQAIKEDLVPHGFIRSRSAHPAEERDCHLHYYVSVNGNVALIAADIDSQCDNAHFQGHIEREGKRKGRSPFPTFDAALRTAARPLPGAVFTMQTIGPAYKEDYGPIMKENKWHLLHNFRLPALPGFTLGTSWNDQPEAITGLLANPDFERAMRRVDKVAWRIVSEIMYERYVAANLRDITGFGLLSAAIYMMGSSGHTPNVELTAGPGSSSVSERASYRRAVVQAPR